MKDNSNTSLCSECGGKCCKSSPGVCFPEDFSFIDGEVDELLLIESIVNGCFCIDYWEGWIENDYEPYFVRPAIKGDNEDKILDAGWGGECIFLTDDGCPMEFDDRPLECRSLVPLPDGCELINGKGKKESAIAWVKYTWLFDLIVEVVERGEKEELIDLFR